MTNLTTQRDIYSVSRLNREVRAVLEGSFPLIWVNGELSNLARPASGHIYFSLKDEIAQVRCAMFRMKCQRLRFKPENGQQVLLRARISLYEGRGEFQLLVEHMEPAGEGALQQAFEQLKQKLDAEGLFDSGRKQPLPSHPKIVGLITSPTGAAVRDLLSVMKHRYPLLKVIVYPVQVQGSEAAEQIREMIQLANRRSECELLILSRGGGSLEDMMAFNDESVARAIASSGLPIISAVGHEIDFTIADFVADLRAATPSAAAELATPDQSALQKEMHTLQQRISYRFSQQLKSHQAHLSQQLRHLQRLHPQQKIIQQYQSIDSIELRLTTIINKLVKDKHGVTQLLSTRLSGTSPTSRLDQVKLKVTTLSAQADSAIKHRIEQRQQHLTRLAQGLNMVSPLATLNRGYAIATHATSNEVLRDSHQVDPNEMIKVKLAKGELDCKVVKTRQKNKEI